MIDTDKTLQPSAKDRVLRKFSTEVKEEFLAYTKQVYVNRGFEEKLADEITHTTCGVKVLTAPPGVGKTIISRHIAKTLCEKQRVQGVCIVSDYSSARYYKSFTQWLLEKVFDVSFDDMECITDVMEKPDVATVPKPYLLIFDQFEDAFGHPDLGRSVKALAQNCCRTNKLQVLACVKGAAQLETLLNLNGRQKITPVYLDFTMPEDTMVERFAPVCNFVRWTPTDEIIKKAAETRNPGFMLHVRDNPSYAENVTLLNEDVKKKKVEMGLMSGDACSIL